MRRLASVLSVVLLLSAAAPLLACQGRRAEASAMACCRSSRQCAGVMTRTAEACCAERAPWQRAPAVAPKPHTGVSGLVALALPHTAHAPAALLAFPVTCFPPRTGSLLRAPLRI
ncbi:MAG: hypothetical protein ACRD17_14340 [Terriglobales bacterium]